jgi:carboxylesterase type B
LWGQSAGAISVDIYNFAWHEDPIVHGLIMDSGTTHLSLFDSPNNTYFEQIASLANCSSSDAVQALDCLRALPARTVEDLVTSSGLSFFPVPDERVVFANYTDRAAQGLLSPVPALIGTNSHEGAALVAYDPAGINETAAELVTLSAFFCPALETTLERLSSGVEAATTHRYYYSGNFSNVSPRPWMGAYHSSELPLLFGTYDIARGEGGPFEAKVSETMQDSWRNFAKNGAEGLEAEAWPEYDEEDHLYRLFVDGRKVVGNSQLSEVEAKCS